jgi:hypothetical protein
MAFSVKTVWRIGRNDVIQYVFTALAGFSVCRFFLDLIEY